jgi:hypothetical protein
MDKNKNIVREYNKKRKYKKKSILNDDAIRRYFDNPLRNKILDLALRIRLNKELGIDCINIRKELEKLQTKYSEEQDKTYNIVFS